jgi:DNA mismatch repair ATPase MutL
MQEKEKEKAKQLIDEMLTHVTIDKFTVNLAIMLAELECRNIIYELILLKDYDMSYITKRERFWYNVIKCIRNYGLDDNGQ